REVRTGLLSYPLDPAAARAHLAASIYVQMALKPQIVHIVGHTEADHAATAEDVIEAAHMAQRVIENALKGAPDLTADPVVQHRKQQLMTEAQVTLEAIRRLGPDSPDPLTDQVVLESAVTAGILDAPQLKNNPFGKGTLKTRIVGGACLALGPDDQPISESHRLSQFLQEKI
ncbi:MAG TPA: methionine synthase, partial [Anaerolineaceae bacterium]|nr:methionine synthase [Anaerolineaceae bacterium]